MKNLIGKIFLLSMFLFGFLIAQENELRPYQLIHADTLSVQKINDEYVSNLSGNVHFFYGETEFFSDFADVFEKQKIARLRGNVEVYDDTLSLFADHVNYHRKEDKLFLNHNVFVKETHHDSTIRTFKADFVKYYRQEKELYAESNVRTFDERENLHGSCGNLVYYQQENYGYLMQDPILKALGEDTLTVSAQKIEYFDDYQKVVATFDVKTVSNDFTIFSNFLLFFVEEEKAIYQGEPIFESEMAIAKAEEFQIFFNEKKIEKAEFTDSCRVDFKISEDQERNSWVNSHEMTFNFRDGKLEFCDARFEVDSRFFQKKNEEKDYLENLAKGNRLIIEIEEEKIKNVDLMKSIRGLYKFEKK